MRTTIDSAGRVVIPKSIRDRAGLQPGAELEVDWRDGAVQISFPRPEGRLVRENGLLVWEPAPGTPPMTLEEVNEAIRVLREERDRF